MMPGPGLAHNRTRNLSSGLSLFVFVVGAVKLLEAVYAAWKVPSFQKEATRDSGPRLPRLSVVVPARDEEAALEKALPTLLGQDYPDLEVILVNDRSADGTGSVLDRFAGAHERARAVHVRRLPEGWLGKNHAVYTGARLATGEWLLFTDADVRFKPGALRRAVARAEADGLDHLTLVPDWELSGYWLRGVVAFFYVVFLLYGGYYRANLPRYKKGAGVGAFNLIRREAYEEIGTYKAFAQRPDDDLALGGRVKRLGLRQRMLKGHDLVSVRWYGTLRELIRGFEKNAFANLGYSLPRAALYSGCLLLVTVGPFAAAPFSTGPHRRLHLVAAASQLGAFAITNRSVGWRVLPLAAGYPVFGLIFTGALLRATLLALRRGGIYWRGTFYPTSLLRHGG